MERLADGELQFRHPNGRLLPQAPHPPAAADDVVAALRTRHEADGLRLGAQTAKPRWFGETLDVGWAIDVMHPRALGSASARAFDDPPFEVDPWIPGCELAGSVPGGRSVTPLHC